VRSLPPSPFLFGLQVVTVCLHCGDVAFLFGGLIYEKSQKCEQAELYRTVPCMPTLAPTLPLHPLLYSLHSCFSSDTPCWLRCAFSIAAFTFVILVPSRSALPGESLFPAGLVNPPPLACLRDLCLTRSIRDPSRSPRTVPSPLAPRR